MKLVVSAPSNIALIKYMGKTSVADNKPTNDSLSYTLEHLRTFVEISVLENSATDLWQPLIADGLTALLLSEKSVTRFLAHFKMLKNRFAITKSFLIRSANNFPSDCGVASSASSFAALTMAAVAIFEQLDGDFVRPGERELAELSRLGSGSSCRSFFTPWALWSKEGAQEFELPQKDLIHQVVIVEGGKKAVSSSDAHKRVSSSLLFVGRPDRAEKRLIELVAAFKSKDWAKAFEISWAEFWDMHALFETSQPSFGYMHADSLRVLNFIRAVWQRENDGPLVTMDAGANIHLLYRQDQRILAEDLAAELGQNHKILSSLHTDLSGINKAVGLSGKESL